MASLGNIIKGIGKTIGGKGAGRLFGRANEPLRFWAREYLNFLGSEEHSIWEKVKGLGSLRQPVASWLKGEEFGKKGFKGRRMLQLARYYTAGGAVYGVGSMLYGNNLYGAAMDAATWPYQVVAFPFRGYKRLRSNEPLNKMYYPNEMYY